MQQRREKTEAPGRGDEGSLPQGLKSATKESDDRRTEIKQGTDKGAEVPNQAAVWEESEAGKYQLPGGKE